MILSLKGFSQFVADGAAAVQSSAASPIDMGRGSVLRAFLEASASVALWLQALILQVWQGTRLATSVGADVDSFVGDFGLTRLPGVAAVGAVTFSRFTTVSSTLIPLGLSVETADLSQTFVVTQDVTNAAWSGALNGYLMAAGVGSVTVPVVALVAGAAGNVQAGTVSIISASAPGVDSVTNALPFENGADAESDATLKARFADYINTRARATIAAVEFAVESTQQGLTYAVAENVDATGKYLPGNFLVTVNDGTGHPSQALLAEVQASVDAVRPIGSTFSVLGPTVVTVAVSLSITVGPTGVLATVEGEVQNAILDYIGTLGIGAVLPYSIISKLAWDADPTITNVTSVTLNGATADIDPGPSGVIQASSVAVN